MSNLNLKATINCHLLVEVYNSVKVCFVYLCCVLPTVDGVFRAGSSAGGAPVEMELSCSVTMRQAGDVHLRGQRYLHCGSRDMTPELLKKLLKLTWGGSRNISFNLI